MSQRSWAPRHRRGRRDAHSLPAQRLARPHTHSLARALAIHVLIRASFPFASRHTRAYELNNMLFFFFCVWLQRYVAVVHGIPSPRTGTINVAIRRHPNIYRKFTSATPATAASISPTPAGTSGSGSGTSRGSSDNRASAGKSANTWYTTMAAGPFGGGASPAAVLQLRIASGRTHQIRVHTADVLGCPVVGDPLYGGSRRQQRQRRERGTAAMRSLLDQLDGRQLLHAHRLGIAHPCSGQPLWIEAPLPQCIRDVWAALALPDNTNNNHNDDDDNQFFSKMDSKCAPPRRG